MKASLKNARISPKKANLVAGMVQNKNVRVALSQLKLTPKKGAKILYKLISSALSNAVNNFQQDEQKLNIKSIQVTKGITYKRGIPVSKGRYHPILKRNSNIVVEIGLDSEALKAETKPTTKKSTEKASEEQEVKTAPKAKKAPAKKTTKAPAAKKKAEASEQDS